MRRALFVVSGLALLSLAPITAGAECIDRDQALREYRHLADGALLCNNGQGLQIIGGEFVRPKATREEEKALKWLEAHPDLSRSEKDRILERARGPEEVQIEKRGNNYYVPVQINGTITLPFLLDTGADDLAIPADLAQTLIRAGALKNSDFYDKRSYQVANGSKEVSPVVTIHDVQVGKRPIRDVDASIIPAQGVPLLGQSFLSRFGAVTVDYNRLVLVLSPR